MRGLMFRLIWARSLLGTMVLGMVSFVVACVAPPSTPRQSSTLHSAVIGEARPANLGKKVAILLPLTGPAAELGQNMLRAAQLALSAPGSPELLQQDTGGNPDGAASAARAAVNGGAGIILGPLTASETAAVTPIARAANVPVLAFTSDVAQGQPGVWPLGITPGQQMRRLVAAVAADHRKTIVAVVPQNLFGEALATGLIDSAKSENLPEPKVIKFPATLAGIGDAMKAVSDYDDRHHPIGTNQAPSAILTNADGRSTPAGAGVGGGQTATGMLPTDTILLGVTGELLGATVPLLSTHNISPSEVQLLGPGTWAREAARYQGLAGAWYAAPDTTARMGFEREYVSRYHERARDYASIAFDAAVIAKTAMTPSGVLVGAIQRPEGFNGADGPISLVPNGTVRRELGLFRVDRGGTHQIQAPTPPLIPGT